MSFTFNPTLVWFQLGVAELDTDVGLFFQSYLSLISTNQLSVEKSGFDGFQSYLSLISTSRGETYIQKVTILSILP